MVSALELYRFGTARIGSRGQLSASNIFGVLILLILLASLMSTIMYFIELAKNVTGPEVDVLLDLIPLFLVVAVIMTLFTYARPHYG